MSIASCSIVCIYRLGLLPQFLLEILCSCPEAVCCPCILLCFCGKSQIQIQFCCWSYFRQCKLWFVIFLDVWCYLVGFLVLYILVCSLRFHFVSQHLSSTHCMSSRKFDQYWRWGTENVVFAAQGLSSCVFSLVYVDIPSSCMCRSSGGVFVSSSKEACGVVSGIVVIKAQDSLIKVFSCFP